MCSCRFKRVNGGRIMVQEYLCGGDLCGQIQTLSQDHMRAFAIFAQIVDAVAHMHRHGFVHNDIKADNILVSKDGVPKLSDFGLSCKIGTPSSGAGTTKFMAPELVTVNNKKEGVPVSPAHDVWSLGVLLFTLLTGRFPWRCAVPEDDNFFHLQGTRFEEELELELHARQVCP